MLDSTIAQKIVDKTMSVTQINVNIMDAEARIIGSGHKDRIGKFHQGAFEVIQNKKNRIINESEARLIPEVKPGITLPIFFNDNIVGAIGMTGDPEKLMKFGELVKFTAELMLEQAYVEREIFFEYRLRANFMNEIINSNGLEDRDIIKRGDILGYNLKLSHHIFAVDAKDIWIDRSRPIKDAGIINDRDRDYFLRDLNQELYRFPDIVLTFIQDILIILVPIRNLKNLSPLEYKEVALEISKSIQILTKHKSGLAYGGVAENYLQIAKRFEIAVYIIDHEYTKKEDLVSYKDVLSEYVLQNIPCQKREELRDLILDKNIDLDSPKNRVLIETFYQYIKNDLNKNTTANSLYIHRNTMIGRIKKIEEVFGYNAENILDMMILYMGLELSKFCEQDSSK